MTPTMEAGMSIWVYTPSQAKYRPIFSPKYFLHGGQSQRDKLTHSAPPLGDKSRPLPCREQLKAAPGSLGQEVESGRGSEPGYQVWGCSSAFPTPPGRHL